MFKGNMSVDSIASRELRDISTTLLSMIPKETGQIPLILLRKLNIRYGRHVGVNNFQRAYDSLYLQGRVFPETDFSKTILGRVYRKEF